MVIALALLPFACGGSSGPATPVDFCMQSDSVACDKLFQCVPAATRDTTFTAMFGSTIAECKGAKAQADCAGATCAKYDAAMAETCLNKVSALTCAAFGNPLPAECDNACQ
jgi:hypothetical protein